MTIINEGLPTEVKIKEPKERGVLEETDEKEKEFWEKVHSI